MIFIVIITKFRLMCPSAFFRYFMSNTLFRFRCVIYRSGFISSSRISSRQKLFSEFFYLKAREKVDGGIVVAGKVGRDLKSNISSFIKLFGFFFCFENGDRFWGVDKKEVGKNLGEREFWYDLSHGKDFVYIVRSQKIVYIVVSWLLFWWGRAKK